MTEQPPFPTGSPSPPAVGLPVALPSGHDPASIAPLMFGTLLQFGVFCIIAMQAVVFFARQGHSLNDSRLFLLYTAAVLLFTTLQVTFGLWRIYNVCVLLRPWNLLPYAWFDIVLSSLAIESVHGFFVLRCYKLSRSKLVLGLTLTMLLMQFAAAISVAVIQVQTVLPQNIRATAIALSSSTLALDSVISIILFVNLWRQRTGQDEVDAVILRIIRITVQSIVPSVVCLTFILIGAVNLGTAPLGSLFPFAVSLATPLYTNALLTSLNSRPGLRDRLSGIRNNGQLSIHENSQFRNSRQSQRMSRSNIHQLTDPAPRGSVSYEIAFTNVIDSDPSRSGGSGSDQTISKSKSKREANALPELCHEYPPSLSSRRARTSPPPRV